MRAPSTSVDAGAVALARLGAGLGVLAGALELAVGPQIRGWVGDKQDTTRLGITTILLSAVALASVSTRGRPVEGRRLAVVLGLLLPGLVCFSTVGRLWLIPGPLLIVSAGMLLSGQAPGELRRAVDRRTWRTGLVVLCGGFYVALGATALGPAGALGVCGGLLVWVSMAVAATRKRVAVVLLVLGAVPFAVATWWSVVTPLVALLIVVLGRAAIREPAPEQATRTAHQPVTGARAKSS